MEHSLLPTYDQEWTYAAHPTMRFATVHKEKVGFYKRLLIVAKIACVHRARPTVILYSSAKAQIAVCKRNAAP